MARKRKKADEGHENSERWLLTYSDMITLLMAFFIMMYSMSVLNLTKFQQVAIAIRSGFGGVVKGGGEHLMDNPAGRKTIKVENGSFDSDSMQETLGKLNDFVIGKGMQKEVQVSDEPRGIVITLAAEGLLFQRGSAELTDKAAPVLDKVVDVLKATPKKKIMVEGHTCNMPINSPIFPSN
ncbi:MAG TPA: flagellar motor protein MotB, partial [Armatimonadota bacterium]|nr:flagellar motor protein MotB [Armatimonadota bacterium]